MHSLSLSLFHLADMCKNVGEKETTQFPSTKTEEGSKEEIVTMRPQSLFFFGTDPEWYAY